MKLLHLSICAIAIVGLTSACATKRYPIATPFSPAEAALMDCDSLALELVRSEQVQLQIAQTGETDWRSVAGFLGDYGIGNAMARSEAERALAERVSAIRGAQAARGCLSSRGGSGGISQFIEDMFDGVHF